MEYARYYCHTATRKWKFDHSESWEEDKVFISLMFNEISRWRRARSDPVVVHDHYNKLAQRDFLISFSHIKQRFWDYEAFFSEHLTRMGVPEDEHGHVINKVFEMVQEAVSPAEAIIVRVWDVTDRVGDDSRRPSLRPASTSSIEGLVQVRLDTDIIKREPSCAICLEDFEYQQEEHVAELPCRHHFHVRCIVQCLEINHLCPLCRYAMPTQVD